MNVIKMLFDSKRAVKYLQNNLALSILKIKIVIFKTQKNLVPIGQGY